MRSIKAAVSNSTKERARSVASFIGMGGYMIGAILGIAGGAVALRYRTRIATQKEPRE